MTTQRSGAGDNAGRARATVSPPPQDMRADAGPPAAPGLDFLATLLISVGDPVEIGPTAEGTRRLIPITGGTVRGPQLNGTVLPGGADFQLLRSATLTELEAKYSIETDTGERIYVSNFGIRSGSDEDIATLVRGGKVDPERIYFRCTPRFLAGGPEWSWLSSRILIGAGTRLQSSVRIDIWILA
ncbi:DUF3237 domain-containing protein [Arthrobacter yangruifuii]|uniref:DUF3237 domain-containing protein n=1 Tax=Arthrobacter yangruifuii TaxID=2606616 RepID=UPI001FEE821C|nr:DUF3237 domain-containing protein [Arthrobacter yangruifuii]